MEHKPFLWVFIFIVLFIVWIGSGLSSSEGKEQPALKVSQPSYIGTTRDPAWQAEYERASDAYNQQWLENPIPDYVRRVLDTFPDQPGK